MTIVQILISCLMSDIFMLLTSSLIHMTEYLLFQEITTKKVCLQRI